MASEKSTTNRTETKDADRRRDAIDFAEWSVLDESAAAALIPAAALFLYFAWIALGPKPRDTPYLEEIEKQARAGKVTLVGNTFVEMLYARAAGEGKDGAAIRAWSEGNGIEQSLTYKDLALAVQAGAAEMKKIGVSQGDRVAFFCKGTLDFFIAFLSVQALGATPVLLNWRQSKENLAGMMEDSNPSFLVVGALQGSRADLFSVAPRSLKSVILLDGEERLVGLQASLWSWRSAQKDLDPHAAVTQSRASEALVLFTSGSTSLPKPVLHTYSTLIWTAETFAFPENTTATLCFLPNFHVIMMVHHFLTALARGFCVSIHAADATESLGARMLLKAASDLKPDVIDTVPFIMEEWSSFSSEELQPLRRCGWVGSGGAPLSKAVAKRLLEAGVPVREYYGQTEAPGIQLSTIPGAAADEISVYAPAIGLAKVVLEGGGEEGELLIQGIENSSPGNLRKGVLVPGSSKMEPAVGHRTGDVWRWTTTASGRRGLVHVMRTDDTILLSTGEMFNPVPMEKSISAFLHGIEGLRGSQVAVLGKNRPSPILVVELPRDHKVDRAMALKKLNPGIDAANAAEVDYARIKPGYTLLLTKDDQLTMPKTAKGNFIRSLSEQALGEAMDTVEVSAKEAQASALLKSAKAAGFESAEEYLAKADKADLKDLGVDSLGVQIKGGEAELHVHKIVDNIKALSMISILIFHFYGLDLWPKLSRNVARVLWAFSETGTIQSTHGRALESFTSTMFVFFFAFGTSEGMADGKDRKATFFGSRTYASVIILYLYKCLTVVLMALDWLSYRLNGHREFAPTSLWFMYAVVYYRGAVRIMQGLRFPRWLQGLAFASPCIWYFFVAESHRWVVNIPHSFWFVQWLFSFSSGVAPCFTCTAFGEAKQNFCRDMFLGQCWVERDPSDFEALTLWRAKYDWNGVAHFVAYYYGEALFLWMYGFSKKVVSHASKCGCSEWNIRLLTSVSFVVAVPACMLLIDGSDCSPTQQVMCNVKQWMFAFNILFLKMVAAVALPFHAKRIGASTLGIFITHRFFPFFMFTAVVDFSNSMPERFGNSNLTSVAQLMLLLIWPTVLCYVGGPTAQWIWIAPSTWIRNRLGNLLGNSPK